MLQSSIMTEHLYPNQSSEQEQPVVSADGEVEMAKCRECGQLYPCERQLGKEALSAVTSEPSGRGWRRRAAFQRTPLPNPSLTGRRRRIAKIERRQREKAMQEKERAIAKSRRLRMYPPAGLATLEDLKNNYIIRQGRTPYRSMLIED